MAHHGGKVGRSKSRNKPNGRFLKYPGGTVPQNRHGRTAEQQLAYLNQRGFVAKRERVRLLRRIEETKKPKEEVKDDTQRAVGSKDRGSAECVRERKNPGRKSGWRQKNHAR